MINVSVVVPCHNEEANLAALHSAVVDVFAELEVDFELILVDDGSRDQTLAVARRLASEDRRVRVLSFSRNFGKEAAMLAGLRASLGDSVAIMDADLQHPPALLAELYTTLRMR